jgi:hypothetical protein
MKIQEFFKGLMGVFEYQERRKLVTEMRVKADALVTAVNFIRTISDRQKDAYMPQMAKLSDEFCKLAAEVKVVIGDDPQFSSMVVNILQAVQDVIYARSTIRSIHETMSDPFEQRTEGFKSFVEQSKPIMEEAMITYNRPKEGPDAFGDRINGEYKALMQYTIPAATKIWYAPKVAINGPV